MAPCNGVIATFALVQGLLRDVQLTTPRPRPTIRTAHLWTGLHPTHLSVTMLEGALAPPVPYAARFGIASSKNVSLVD
jgi:hypothetical protein